MRLSRWIAPLALASLGVTALVLAPPASAAATLTVAADGSGQYRTVQAAVNAAASGDTISIKAGVYRGAVNIPSNKRLSLLGGDSDASRTVLVESHASGQTKPGGGTWGTAGSATVTVLSNDTLIKNLTMSNDFDENSSNISSKQAVAAANYGDRVVFDNVRILGNQDTLLAYTPSTTTKRRLYVRKSYIEGDVDFIFGSGTVVFQQCTIHSLSRSGGVVTAAATDINNKFGFLFWSSTFTGSAPSRSVYLGRPWHPSNDPNARGQVLIRSSTINGHIRTDPWTDMAGFRWQDARFSQYGNSGAGAGYGPQMSAATAAQYTPEAYLLGSDNWKPIR